MTPDQWNAIVEAFVEQTAQMRTSFLLLIANNGAELTELANQGYDPGDPTTWEPASAVSSRIEVLQAIVFDEIDRRVPVPGTEPAPVAAPDEPDPVAVVGCSAPHCPECLAGHPATYDAYAVRNEDL